MAPHSSTLAWKIPWTEEPGRLQSMGSLRVGHDWATSLSLFTFLHWRRKWQPTPVSCLENPRDGGAWWAAVSGVTQSWTRLKRLSSSSSSRDLDTCSYKYREPSVPVAASATLHCVPSFCRPRELEGQQQEMRGPCYITSVLSCIPHKGTLIPESSTFQGCWGLLRCCTCLGSSRCYWEKQAGIELHGLEDAFLKHSFTKYLVQ